MIHTSHWMSDRSRRAKIDIDYIILHNTGEKVLKTRESIEMDYLNEKSVQELQIGEDISETLLLYDLNDLETEKEISEGIEKMSELGLKYRHIHVLLKSLMGEAEYAEKYVEYPNRSLAIREYVSTARQKIKNSNQVVQEKLNQATEFEKKQEEAKLFELKEAEQMKVRTSLQIEEQVFGEKIEREVMNFELHNVHDIQKSCDRFERILDDYYKLLSNVKITFGDKYETECLWKQNFQNNIEKIEKQIKLGKAKVHELNEEAQKLASQGKTEHEKQAHEAFVNEQKFNCEILGKELEMRCTTLIKNCDISAMSDMSDYQIFECHKRRHVIDTELREIFDKFTSYSKMAALCTDDRDALMVKPCLDQKNALEARNNYAKKLHSLMTERDISAEKLRNAATTSSVELSKFKGYDSKLDVYSFRTEFEKLIQPSIQKHLWVDTLKNNYLSGPAFTLVERTEKMEDIWEKLIGAYGNVKLLLQNKIGKVFLSFYKVFRTF